MTVDGWEDESASGLVGNLADIARHIASAGRAAEVTEEPVRMRLNDTTADDLASTIDCLADE